MQKLTPLLYPQAGISDKSKLGLNCGYEEFKKKRENFKKGKIAPEQMNALINDEDFVSDKEPRKAKL